MSCATVVNVDLIAGVTDPTPALVIGLTVGFVAAGYLTGWLLAASGRALVAGAATGTLTLCAGLALLSPAMILIAVAAFVPGYVRGRRRATRLRRQIVLPNSLGSGVRSSPVGRSQTTRAGQQHR